MIICFVAVVFTALALVSESIPELDRRILIVRVCEMLFFILLLGLILISPEQFYIHRGSLMVLSASIVSVSMVLLYQITEDVSYGRGISQALFAIAIFGGINTVIFTVSASVGLVLFSSTVLLFGNGLPSETGAIIGMSVFAALFGIGNAHINRRWQMMQSAQEKLYVAFQSLPHDVSNPLISARLQLEEIKQGVRKEIDVQRLERDLQVAELLISDRTHSAYLNNQYVDQDGFEIISLGSLFSEIAENLQTIRPISSDSSVHSIKVWGNRAALIRVFQNLFSNASKYSPDRDYRISVYREAGHVNVDVFNKLDPDNIPDISRIFDSGYRGPKSQKWPGAGVGLAIAKDTVEALGGKLSCALVDGRILFRLTLKEAKPDR